MKKSLMIKNLQVLGLLVLALVLLCPESAMAAKSDIFSTIQAKMVSTVKDVRQLVYVVSGFGLVMFAVLAIFNKISWKHLGYIMISLTLLSLMTPFLNYFGADLKDDVNYGNFLAGGDASVVGSDVTDLKKCEGQDCPPSDPLKAPCEGEACGEAGPGLETEDGPKAEDVKIEMGNVDAEKEAIQAEAAACMASAGEDAKAQKKCAKAAEKAYKNLDKQREKEAKSAARAEAREQRKEARQEAREQWKSDWKEASGAERMGMLIKEAKKGVDAVKKVGSAVNLGKNAAMAAIKGAGQGKAMVEGLKGVDFSQGNFLDNLSNAARITTNGLTGMGSSFGSSIGYAGGAVGNVASGVSTIAPNTGLSDGLNTIATATQDVTGAISDGMATAGNLIGEAGRTVSDGASATSSLVKDSKNTPQDMENWMKTQGF